MLSTTPDIPRFLSLRHLNLCFSHKGPIPHPPMGPEVAEFFLHAHHLEVLEVAHMETLLEREQGISKAISSLTSLVDLQLAPEAHAYLTLAMLSVMQSPLKIFSSSCHSTTLDILRNFATTLEDLSLNYPASTFETTRPFPFVKRLAVTLAYDLDVHPFVHNFPHLERVYIDSIYVESDIAPEQLEIYRQSNTIAQSSWSNLNYVGGDIFSIYVLGLNCRRGDLLVLGVNGSNVHLLRLILSNSFPSRLKLVVSASSLAPEDLRGLLQVAPTLDLTYLNITLCFTRHSRPSSYLVRCSSSLMQTLSSILFSRNCTIS